ncbi:phage portal protein [Caenispirillum bisanense]|uniref:Phage portal protein, lambda family n=1 Tax=Caenispirillum bisanense TaxID=414052 RepID=A0A286GNB7_9PROT|nr:phage portal protein [Caenispirillum bisanense]SOD97027.1 phage portal protein, lambda family [Caenispirillum bisanense]
MGLFDIFRRTKNEAPTTEAKRQVDKQTQGRLLPWLGTSSRPSYRESTATLRHARDESRNLAQNNVYAKRGLQLLRQGVVGPSGIRLQVQALNNAGKLDTVDSAAVERAWYTFSKKGNLTVCGRWSLTDVLGVIIESVCDREGEILIRRHRGPHNKFGYALQLIEPDHLDENYNGELNNGNIIRAGIETNQYGKPVAYHLFESHPRDTTGGGKRVRVPADEIWHLYIPHRPTDLRGNPGLASAAFRVGMLESFEEAAVTAARNAARRVEYLKQRHADGLDTDTDATTDAAKLVDDELGTMWLLPSDLDHSFTDPKHPTANYAEFVKAQLRGISISTNNIYNDLAGDMEGVNYSALRHFRLQQVDYYRTLQQWLITDFLTPLFEEWLPLALLSGGITIPRPDASEFPLPFKPQKYSRHKWIPRGYEWVDPQKQVTAEILAIKAGIKTLSDVLAEQGKDFDEHVARLAAEREVLAAAGISIEGITDALLISTNTDANE